MFAWLRIITISLLTLWSVSAQALQTYNIYNWYWIAQDHNPTTQVFSSASGTFVANTDATYLLWLANGNADNANPITGAANNGSGAVRLTIGGSGTANWATNQYWNVSGTGLYDQNWEITVVDATHVDLQTSTYSAAVTTGFVSGATVIATQAGIFAAIDSFNQLLPRPGYVAFGSATPTNPLAWWMNLNSGIGGTLTLPLADVPGSMPLGRAIIIANNSLATLTINDSSSSLVATVLNGAAVAITLIGNTTTHGSYQTVWLPTVYWPNVVAGYSSGGTNANSLAGAQANFETTSVIASATLVNFNSVADTALAFTMPTGYTRFYLRYITISHASHDLTTAQFGVFTTTSGSGAALIASGTAITVSATADQTSNNMQQTTGVTLISSVAASLATPNTIYFRVTNAEGATATGDVTAVVNVMP